MSIIDVDAFVLAAGYGKRLRPLTEKIPKALVEVADKSLIEWNMELLVEAGFSRVLVNGYYLKEQLALGLHEIEKRLDVEIEYVEEEELLDTGGAIKNIRDKLRSKTLLTVNCDVLLDRKFPLTELLEHHRSAPKCPLATLVLRADPRSADYGELGIDEEQRICRFLGTDYVEAKIAQTLMYTGVQVLSDKIFNFMPGQDIFSITQDVYPRALSAGAQMEAFVFEGYWRDVGTLASLELANEESELLLRSRPKS